MTQETVSHTTPEEAENALPETVEAAPAKPCNCKWKRQVSLLAAAVVLLLAAVLAVRYLRPSQPGHRLFYRVGNTLYLSDGPGVPELLDSGVNTRPSPRFTARGELVYFKNKETRLGDLYADGQLIARQVCVNTNYASAMPETGWYYLVPTQEDCYDLYLKQPEEEAVFVAGGLVYPGPQFLGNNPVYFIPDSTDSPTGTLTVYDVSEGVCRTLAEQAVYNIRAIVEPGFFL